VTGQPNAGSHNGEMCYNVVGTYLDDEFYSFESDTLDLLLWSEVNVEFTIASSLRNGDQFAFYYYDSATSSWSGYDISGLVGNFILEWVRYFWFSWYLYGDNTHNGSIT
jgi:hypothetical protein